MAEGNSKKKRSTSGEESQATTEDGVIVDPKTGEILDDGSSFDVFDEDPGDDVYQGGGYGGDMQESYNDDFQESFFEESQVKHGRSKE